jgi:hypothetical protein
MWGTAMAADVLTRVQAEIDERLRALRPAVAEYERLLDAATSIEDEATVRPAAAPKPASRRQPASTARAGRAVERGTRAKAKLEPAPTGAAEQAIVAALEHGSHTVGELGVVTAMSGAEIRAGARRLLQAGRIVRAKREGRAAYALAAAA